MRVRGVHLAWATVWVAYSVLLVAASYNPGFGGE